RRMRRWGLVVVVLAVFASPAAAQAALTASASPKEIKYQQSTTISGKATPGMLVRLEEKPSGQSSFSDVNTIPADPTDGSYEFADLKPGFNTTYRVSSGTDKPVTLRVIVDEIVSSKLTPLGLGRMRLRLSSQHPSDLKWAGRRVYVFVAQGSRFHLVVERHTTQKGEITRLTADFP